MKSIVLVVDDDAAIRESLRKVLQAEGYEVLLAVTSEEALDKFDPARIDVLLLDLQLPVKSGWEIFERFTSINPLLATIIITGRANQYQVAAAAGVGALMEKPLDVPLLLRTITALLAETGETRVKRLIGLKRDVRYAPARKALSPRYQNARRVLTNEVSKPALGMRSV